MESAGRVVEWERREPRLARAREQGRVQFGDTRRAGSIKLHLRHMAHQADPAQYPATPR